MSVIDLFRLDGKVAVITGASSGLGVALAVGMADAGADIVVCARRRERLTETANRVRELGRRCVVVEADVTDVAACANVVEEAMRDLGRIDVLVNNAGLGTAVPALRETEAEFRRVIEVNLLGSYWMAQACARVMAPGSAIINIGSAFGSVSGGLPQAAYSSSKAAIIGLTRDLAVQWSGRRGIRVNALAPGFFPTEMTDELPEGYVESMMPRVPIGRVGTPSELVPAAVFLASDAAAYVTGVLLPVDGGFATS